MVDLAVAVTQYYQTYKIVADNPPIKSVSGKFALARDGSTPLYNSAIFSQLAWDNKTYYASCFLAFEEPTNVYTYYVDGGNEQLIRTVTYDTYNNGVYTRPLRNPYTQISGVDIYTNDSEFLQDRIVSLDYISDYIGVISEDPVEYNEYVCNQIIQYQWTSVPAISGKNGILSLAMIDDDYIGDGSPVTGADYNYLVSKPESARIGAMPNLVIGQTVDFIWSGDAFKMTVTRVSASVMRVAFYLNQTTPGTWTAFYSYDYLPDNETSQYGRQTQFLGFIIDE